MVTWASCTLIFSPVPPPRTQHKPVVAILSDHFDIMQGDIKDRLIRVQGNPGGHYDRSNQAEPGSHGTTMASLVLKMCPQATILPICLNIQSPVRQQGATCFTAQSAAEVSIL